MSAEIELPRWFLPRPAAHPDIGTCGSFEQLLASTVERGAGTIIDYTLPAPEFRAAGTIRLSWAAGADCAVGKPRPGPTPRAARRGAARFPVPGADSRAPPAGRHGTCDAGPRWVPLAGRLTHPN